METIVLRLTSEEWDSAVSDINNFLGYPDEGTKTITYANKPEPDLDNLYTLPIVPCYAPKFRRTEVPKVSATLTPKMFKTRSTVFKTRSEGTMTFEPVLDKSRYISYESESPSFTAKKLTL